MAGTDGLTGSDGGKPLDLTTIAPAEQGGSGGDLPPVNGTPVKVAAPEPIDVTRKGIAYFLLALLTFVIALEMVFGGVYSAHCWATSRYCADAQTAMNLMTSSLNPIFTAMIGLVGSVVGFYFGSSKQQ